MGDLKCGLFYWSMPNGGLFKKIQRGLRSLLDEMQTEAVLSFHLSQRVHTSAKATELGKFLLDSL